MPAKHPIQMVDQHAAKIRVNSVRQYFSEQAARYQTKMQAWPWQWIRDVERRSLLAALPDVSGKQVLELGCGAGYYTRWLLDKGAATVFAVDVSPEMLAMLPSSNVTPILGDAATVRLKERFSVIVSAGLLEFVPEPAAVLETAAAHAVGDADLLVLAPGTGLLARAYRQFHRSHALDITLFDPAQFRVLAERSGWTVTSISKGGPFAFIARLTRTHP